jgi:hypothetical protein
MASPVRNLEGQLATLSATAACRTLTALAGVYAALPAVDFALMELIASMANDR